jgi:hypothetical protein
MSYRIRSREGAMAAQTNREAFIPYRRTDLIELCIDDGQLPGEDVQKFRDFCEILTAYYHVKSQRTLEVLKDSFAPFNPDADTRTRRVPTAQDHTAMEQRLVQAFETVLQRANYSPLSPEDLQGAFAGESLIPLKTRIDFDDYAHMVFYYRGDNFKTAQVKRWFRQREVVVDNFERVALLLRFKEADHFAAKKQKVAELNFTPGKMYLYLYKNVPRYDLELLFPNVQVSMNWLDRLLVLGPAIGAAVPLLLRVLPSLLLIIGVILLVIFGAEFPSRLGLQIDDAAAQNIFPVLIATMSIGMALGGFAAKQYSTYKNKRLKFLKRVTDTLFFKNLVTNQGVLYTLVDAAEEEECKEIILVYYHLLVAGQPLTRDQLDRRIEQWMEQTWDTRIDFDIDKTLANLIALRVSAAGAEDVAALVQVDAAGAYQARPLDEARAVIDYVWDNIFQYAATGVAEFAPALMERTEA